MRMRQRPVDPGLELAAEGQESRHHRDHRQNNQRRRHAPRRLMRMRRVFIAMLARRDLFTAPILAEERHVDRPHHVGRRQTGRQQAKHEHALVVVPRLDQNFILRPEPRQRHDPGQRQRADHERGKGDRHHRPQTAHLAHVERVRRVVHRPRTEEQHRLEERVRHQVEHRRRVPAHPDREHHVGQLRDRRIGQHPLDIDLHHRQHRRAQRGARPNPGDQIRCRRGGVNHREKTRQQVDARRDHRGRVDQRRDRRRTLHRVRQPDVQRELRRLADRARDQAQPRTAVIAV